MKFHKTTCDGKAFLELAERQRLKEIVVYGWTSKVPGIYVVSWGERLNIDNQKPTGLA